MLVEESHAFGVLGATGRGACEHFGLGPSQVGRDGVGAADVPHAALLQRAGGGTL